MFSYPPPGKVEPISPILMLENLMLALGKLASMSDGTPEFLLELQAGYGSKTMCFWDMRNILSMDDWWKSVAIVIMNVTLDKIPCSLQGCLGLHQLGSH